MQVTRRYWEFVGVAITLVLGAVVFAEPLLFVGAAGIFGWLLAIQVAFVHAVSRFDRSLVIEQSVTPAATLPDEPVTCTLKATGESNGLDVTISVRPSAGMEIDGTATVSLGEMAVVSVKSSIVGTHTLRTPTVSITDTRGLFSERLARGPPREITVQSREPNQVYIGKGGESIPIAFGEHAVDVGNSGLVPAELREYTGSESLSRIDWKATARLATPYVREFEAESEIPTILVLDRRSRVNVGPPGETAFAYLRSAALSYLTVVQSLNDPVGSFTVSKGRVEKLVDPTSSTHKLASLRRRLESVSVASARIQTQRSLSLDQRSPLLNTETEFGRTLASYTAIATTAPNTDPLPIAVRQAANTQHGTVHLAVFTDDRDHAELRAMVSEATRARVQLSLFLAPHTLYEPTIGITERDLKDRYREFEQFRRQLAAIDGVTAYEVAPREQIERVLETQGSRH